MRNIMLAFALTFVLAPGIASAKVHQGAPAPDMVLKDKAGNDVKLSDYRGKVVLMDFWTTWCAPCKKEVPAMEVLARKYAAAGKPVVFLAINYDQKRANADKWLAGSAFSALTFLFDQEQKCAGQYEPGPPLPGSFLIGPDGVVRYTHDGFVSGDEKVIAAEIDKLVN